MKKNKIIHYLLLLTTLTALCHAAVYDRKIARDAEPGGIYFIAPDVSTDSLVQMHVFYSPDTGHTIYIVRTYDEDYAIDNIELAADLRPGTVYLIDMDSPTTDILVSHNNGLIWNDGGHGYTMSVSSGCQVGEVAITCGRWSTDFGETFSVGSATGWTSSDYYFSVGNAPGMLWASRADGYVFITTDYSETFDTLCAMPKCNIRRGHLDNEAFLISIDYAHYDSIFYSLDACTTFVFRYPIDFPRTPTPAVGSSGFDRGWQQSEILAMVNGFNYTSYYPDPPPHWHGGWFRIFVSNDQGASWRLIVEHGYGAPDAIEERERNYEQNVITYNGREIFAAESIKLYDISGRFITEGRTIRTDMLRDGLYIARTKTASRKVLVVN